MTKREMLKLTNEVASLVKALRDDIREGYIQDALDCLCDIQGISCQIEEGCNERLK